MKPTVKKPKLQYVLLALVTATLFAIVASFKQTSEKESVPEIEIVAPVLIPVQEEELTLEQFTLLVMNECGANISQAKLSLYAKYIASVAEARIDSYENQRLFIMLLCIESKFDNRARSPVGAVGLAQIMPKYAQNFADLCNLGKLQPGDEADPVMNLTLGACLFNSLTVQLGSSILAVAAYNAGPNSSSVRNLTQLGNPVPETASYVAKLSYLKEKVDESTTKSVPAAQNNNAAVPDGKRSSRTGERDPVAERSPAPVPSVQPTE